MIGLTTYRDYFADAASVRSSKFEALSQYMHDLGQIVGDDIECVPTRLVGKGGDYSKYDKLLVFEHPTSTMKTVKSGFTTANVGPHLTQLRQIVDFKGPLYSYGLAQNVDYKTWVRNIQCRRDNPNTSHYDIPTDAEMLAFFERALANDLTEQLAEHRYARTDFAVGDSHTVMLWRPDRTVDALYGRTLYRAVSEGLRTLVPLHVKSVAFCFGNIDLRHHLMRQSNPMFEAKQLAKQYAEQADAMDCETSVCELLPIIDPARRVTKSYYFKKEPHAGTAEEREELRKCFNETLHESVRNTEVLRVPSHFVGDDGLLKPEVIEATKGGIHIGPSYYEMTATLKTNNPENAWLP